MLASRTRTLDRCLAALGLEAVARARDLWTDEGAAALERLLVGRVGPAHEPTAAMVSLFDPAADSRVERRPGSEMRRPAWRLNGTTTALVAARRQVDLDWSILWRRVDLVPHAGRLASIFRHLAERLQPLAADSLVPRLAWPGALVVSAPELARPSSTARSSATPTSGIPHLLVSFDPEAPSAVASSYGTSGIVFSDAHFRRRWRNVSPLDACWSAAIVSDGAGVRLTPLRDETLPLRVAAVDDLGRPLEDCEWILDGRATFPERHPRWPEVWSWPDGVEPRVLTLSALPAAEVRARLFANPLVLELTEGDSGRVARYPCGEPLNSIAGLARHRALTRVRAVAARRAPHRANPLTAWDVSSAIRHAMLEVREARVEATDAVALHRGRPALVRAVDLSASLEPASRVELVRPAVRAALGSIVRGHQELEVGDVQLVR